mmetsp:Transcript_22364/g.27409  ORF Transcript_22364/g.27409 Transcript_22364/m.27409 type:complete len:171 (-) Transcript_22364:266-778(-)
MMHIKQYRTPSTMGSNYTTTTSMSSTSKTDSEKSAHTSLTETGTNKMKRNTSFSHIEIREYNITLGDNPGGVSGPPISLDWDYDEMKTQRFNLEQFEEMRPPRRSRGEMYMGGSVRTFRLIRESGLSKEDIKKAEKSAEEVRKQRQITNKNVIRNEKFKKRIWKVFNRSS